MNRKEHIKDIPRAEFIGVEVEVMEAANPSLLGLRGKIVNETKNLFTIETKTGEIKKIIKNQVTLKASLKGKKVLIKGTLLQGRPEERMKKRVKI